MKAYLTLCIIILFTFACVCCSNQEPKKEQIQKIDNALLKEKMIESNKHLARTENNQITNYIQRRGWTEMKREGSGFWLWEYQKGKGDAISFEEQVSIKYTLELINGRKIGSSEKDGIKTFKAGKEEVERGLDEAVLMLRKGSKARVIIPSILGYGFVGNGEKIPKHAILIYDIEII